MPLSSMLVIYANQTHPLVLNQGLWLQYEDQFILNSKIHNLPLSLYIFTLPVKTLPLRAIRLSCSLPSYWPCILTVVPVMYGGWFLPSSRPSLFSFLLMGRCGGADGAWWMIPSILSPIFPFLFLSFPSFKWNRDSRPKGWGRIHGFHPPDQNRDKQSASHFIAPLRAITLPTLSTSGLDFPWAGSRWWFFGCVVGALVGL